MTYHKRSEILYILFSRKKPPTTITKNKKNNPHAMRRTSRQTDLIKFYNKEHITVTRSLHLLRWALVQELGPKYCFLQQQYFLCNTSLYNSGLILYINNINQKTVKTSWVKFMVLIARWNKMNNQWQRKEPCTVL